MTKRNTNLLTGIKWMQLIGSKADFNDSDRYELLIENINYLLIYQSEKYYLLVNQCGHFGISLYDAGLEPNTIICSGHGISFDLTTGEILNRPYENCDKIKTYDVIEIDGQLFFDSKASQN